MNPDLQEQTDTIVRSIELVRNDLGEIALTLMVMCALVFALLLIIAFRRVPRPPRLIKPIKPKRGQDEQDMM